MINYYEYIKSDAWYKRTEQVRKRNGGMCEACNMRFGSEVHHRTYEHLGNELDEELIHLCWSCHGYVHEERHGHIFSSSQDFLDELRNEVRLFKTQQILREAK